jgi:hypothetical protein
VKLSGGTQRRNEALHKGNGKCIRAECEVNSQGDQVDVHAGRV